MPSYTQVLVQSAALKAAANLTAQVATGWKGQPPQPVDWQRVAEFAIFGLIQSHLNWWWQQGLENMLPTRRTITKHDTKENGNGDIVWANVMCKLILDQTLGLFIMNSTFIACTNALRIRSLSGVAQVVRKRIWTIIFAAWKIWPWVSICNFIWVPVESRVLVTSLVGFGWNIFLALLSMA
jgi:hypothetical protein